MLSADLLCSGSLLALVALVLVAFGLRAMLGEGTRAKGDLEKRPESPGQAPKRPGLPGWVKAMSQWFLDPLVRLLIRAGVSASMITGASLVLGTVSAVLLGIGHFGIAGVVFVVASLGDTLDGTIARRTNTASPAGALFDSSVDRYEEFFTLSGIAMFFRQSPAAVALVLLCLLGSFMVSYGSAKAEALRVKVPPGWMRRAERAVCVAVGTTLVPITSFGARELALPDWVPYAPVWLALGLVGVVANVSAVMRLRAIAVAASSPGTSGPA
jgi:CDP-diacylglycerol---glycerol-3-phosphate 3-phosphatidyltransferase